MVPWIFLVSSLIGAAFTFAALVPARKIGPFVIPYFFAAWLASELPLHHIAWQALATLVFIGLGALGAAPGWVGLALTLASWWGLWHAYRLGDRSRHVFEDALAAAFGIGYRDHVPAEIRGFLPEASEPADWLRPFRMRRPDVRVARGLAYGDAGKRHLLDVIYPLAEGKDRAVLLQLHGGGWTIGEKEQQGQPLMHEFASRGWVCVAPNYRLSPAATFPDPLIDAKRALAWIRDNAADYGGNPDFVIVTGGSAGGHLAALVALTANQPEYQPGFEEVDTHVAAAVPFYGIYDFLDRENFRGHVSMRPFLKRFVMKSDPEEAREAWEEASPRSRVHADAPPFMVIHGTHDSLSFVEDGRAFVRALRTVSQQPVAYAEIPGAQHAFDTFHSVRSRHAINAVVRFAEYVRARS